MTYRLIANVLLLFSFHSLDDLDVVSTWLPLSWEHFGATQWSDGMYPVHSDYLDSLFVNAVPVAFIRGISTWVWEVHPNETDKLMYVCEAGLRNVTGDGR